MDPTRSRGRRRKRLCSVARAVRARPDGRADPGSNPELLALVETPYTDVEEARDRLRALLSALEARNDRRAVFLTIYARMTAAVADRGRRGAFADPDWVGDYLVTFANLYREAVRDYGAGAVDALPEPWRLAFEAADRGDSLVVQNAALGVNAHINYDLAFALAEVGLEPDRARKFEDHSAVTGVIDDLVDGTQASLAARDAEGIASVDAALAGLDEHLLVVTIDECRDSAWRTARALGSRFPPRRRLARWINRKTATRVARFIPASKASETVHGTLRTVESGDGGE